MIVPLEHLTAGPIRVLGTPLKLSDTPASIRTPPPALGQHTAAILRQIWTECSGDRRVSESPALSPEIPRIGKLRMIGIAIANRTFRQSVIRASAIADPTVR